MTTMAAMLDIFLCSITRKRIAEKKFNMADAVTILGDDVTWKPSIVLTDLYANEWIAHFYITLELRYDASAKC